MKIFITGATGFIGSHLVKTLQEKNNCEIKCLVRKNSETETLQKCDVELFFGDLLDENSLKEGVQDCNVIYHLAGKVFAQKIEDFLDVNVTGTKNLLEAAVSAKIEKFIYFSSIAAVGPNRKLDVLLSEDSPCRPITSYGKSKYEAEKLVHAFSKNYELPSIIIRPPMVYGPGATDCRSAKLFKMIREKKFIFIGNGKNKLNTCYIENLIHGVLLLNEKKKILGEKIFFFADAEVSTMQELVNLIAAKEGVKVNNIHIPVICAKFLAMILQGLGKVLHFTPMINLEMVGELINSWNYDMTLGTRELGYVPKVQLHDGIGRTVSWYRCKRGIV